MYKQPENDDDTIIFSNRGNVCHNTVFFLHAFLRLYLFLLLFLSSSSYSTLYILWFDLLFVALLFIFHCYRDGMFTFLP